MIVEKPIDVPLMTKEQEKALMDKVTNVTLEEIEEHQRNKPQFPKGFDTDNWNVE